MRNENKYLVEQIKNNLEQQDYFFIISYTNLKSKEQENFKSLLREKKATLQIQKNSLIKKSAQSTKFAEIEELDLKNTNALVFGKGEASITAKIIKNFSKDYEQIKFKFSFVEGSILNSEQSLEIAELPSRESAQAQLLGLLNSIPQKFVSLLNAVPSGIVNVLNARKNSME